MSDDPVQAAPEAPQAPSGPPREPASPGSPCARVVIVDDDPLVRTVLSMILGGSTTINVVAEAEDGEQAQEVVARERPQVVLMDIRMPRRDGISATEGLLALPHPPKVIVLTTFDTDDQVLAALRAGASGFLLKDTPPPKIVEAVHRVIAGEPILSPSVTAQLIASATDDQPTARRDDALTHLASLTERERDVAVAIGQGLSNAEIAAELYLSVATVKSHVTRLFAKLRVDNRVQIAMRVHDAGLV
ncbi:response regulator transcription factor [Actinotalea sp. K2]|uniref:response regulator n=1 Tax=Actinotalea sp. K2 TaxID=2939438 RepID=UPI0024B51B12|nr:response regulator transcription factor [Actinotalea sp. K2]